MKVKRIQRSALRSNLARVKILLQIISPGGGGGGDSAYEMGWDASRLV